MIDDGRYFPQLDTSKLVPRTVYLIPSPTDASPESTPPTENGYREPIGEREVDNSDGRDVIQ